MGRKPQPTLKNAITEHVNDRWLNQFAPDTIDKKGYLEMMLADIEFSEWGFNWPGEKDREANYSDT
jgi:hypothetical protein